MPIEKGEAWGEAGTLPATAPIARSDAEAAAMIGSHQTIGLEAGDLARTLGMRAPYDRSGSKHLAPVDGLVIELADGARYQAIAHVLVGHPLWSRECTALMNAAFLGKRNLAPRAHPGDAKIDIVSFSLGATDRVKAWRRMPTGSHLPHPQIRTSRGTAGTLTFAQPQKVRVDGQAVGVTTEVTYQLQPDAITIAV